MPSRLGRRPLKAWRYVGVFSPELMLCAATVRIGPVRQAFWALWDRGEHRLYERTTFGRGAVRLSPGRIVLAEPHLQIDIALEEAAGIETICASGSTGYAWTRKQGGVPAYGNVTIGGRSWQLEAAAIIDDSAGYHARHTHWRWSAGVGVSRAGASVAWNLVEGINDPPSASERTVWLDGVAREAPPSHFARDLSAVGQLRFVPEAARERNENRLLVRSRYRQPFGTFSGRLPGGVELAEGCGVMEEHDVHW